MNRRILKIDTRESFEKIFDPDAPKFSSNYGSVRITGFDKDRDNINICFENEDALEYIELAQALARQEKSFVNQIKSQIGMIEHTSSTEPDLDEEPTTPYR